ncbi:hypothetical protein RDI58_022033 [Solanum bulbocastanum]|uniref:Uncharacterized protein n=1 Tax=Solanum bulbocastanum TaxID=147425 RepID=A0AAN8T1Y4_SOLBU
MQDMLHEAFGIPPTSNFVDMDTSAEGFDGSNQHNMGFDKKTEEFFRLLKEAERELYPGSKYSLLAFLVRLLHLKCLNGRSNKSFSMLLELLKDMLPEGETLPKSFYDSKKIIKDLGLEYKKIHACPNDCMIYWNEMKDRTSCKFCKAPRYKQFKGASVNSSSETSKIPSKANMIKKTGTTVVGTNKKKWCCNSSAEALLTKPAICLPNQVLQINAAFNTAAMATERTGEGSVKFVHWRL